MGKVTAKRPDYGVIRLSGLDDEAAGGGAATAAALELREGLEGFFVAAVIGAREEAVGLQDGGEAEVAEVEAFGDHLGADEDAGLPFREIPYDLLLAGSITVEPCDILSRENLPGLILDLLCAGANEAQLLAAGRASPP